MPSPTCFTKWKEQPCILFSLYNDTWQGITEKMKKNNVALYENGMLAGAELVHF
jgi:hypothetical protein